MEVPETLVSKQLYLLGDANGYNRGRVGEYNRVQVQVKSPMPLEQDCYFLFKFPQKLRIDSVLQLVVGQGIFKPAPTLDILPTDLYSVDIEKNTITVQGCQVPESLTTAPGGSVEFHYIKLPDYVTGTDPIDIQVFSAKAMDASTIVIDDPSGVPLGRDQMVPGNFTQLQFQPSNFFAFATQVSYQIVVVPQHDLYPESKIVITMPPTLTFNQAEGCNVGITIADCSLDAANNILTLTNIFDDVFFGGQQLKFRISAATNPQGARPAGPWSIHSENLFDGNYEIVDGQTSPESFYAKPGNIWSTLSVDSLLTFDDQTVYEMEFETQHNIPPGGYLNVTLPDECFFDINLTEPQSLDQMDYINMTDKYVLFFFEAGHSVASNPLWARIDYIRNPRSFRPSTGFTVTTMDQNGYVIDAGG